MERRTVLKIIGIGAITPQLHSFAAATSCSEHAAALVQLRAPTSEYRLRFFTPQENELVDQLSELIIPADAHSPGAKAARVSLFADLMVATSDEQTKRQWRNGLQLIKNEAEQSSLSGVLATIAANEADPKTELDRLFVTLKQMVVDGYYTSSIGLHQDLAYQGNGYLSSFPGCTHPEHQS